MSYKARESPARPGIPDPARAIKPMKSSNRQRRRIPDVVQMRRRYKQIPMGGAPTRSAGPHPQVTVTATARDWPGRLGGGQKIAHCPSHDTPRGAGSRRPGLAGFYQAPDQFLSVCGLV
jgi:hypothetical protein